MVLMTSKKIVREKVKQNLKSVVGTFKYLIYAAVQEKMIKMMKQHNIIKL